MMGDGIFFLALGSMFAVASAASFRDWSLRPLAALEGVFAAGCFALAVVTVTQG
jgi:hypothetical protein